MHTITVNGKPLPLNLMDADVRERCDEGIKKLVAYSQDKANFEGKSEAEGMRILCRAVDSFFNAAFGDGTAADVFGENYDLELRLQGFSDVCAEYYRANDRIEAIKNRFVGIASGNGGVTPDEHTH